MGGALASYSGTRSRHYYNIFDPVSWGGATMDLISPDVADPGRKFDVLNLDHWKIPGIPHLNKDTESYSLWDLYKEIPVAGVALDVMGVGFHNLSRGLSNDYWKYFSPTNRLHKAYNFWSNFDVTDGSDWGDIALYGPRRTWDMGTDIVDWSVHYGKDLGSWGNRTWRKTKNIFTD